MSAAWQIGPFIFYCEQRSDRLPLCPQADKGHWQALRVLTETAAYVDVQDAAGRSVLYLAAQRGYARCVEVLLAQGASCLLNDNRSMWTPIHVAGILRSAAVSQRIAVFFKYYPPQYDSFFLTVKMIFSVSHSVFFFFNTSGQWSHRLPAHDD